MLASALAVGATTLVAGTGAANASLPGAANSPLTSSNGSTTIRFAGGGSLASSDNLTDVAWAPDGSQALYVDNDGNIAKLRHNDAQNIWSIVDSPALRRGPSWRGDGSGIVWAERASASVPWTIRVGANTSGWTTRQISPADGNHYLNPDGGADLRIVFQRQADSNGTPTGTPAVVLYDPLQPEGSQISVVDENGANPAISPDGTKVAFVRDGQIIVSDLAGDNEVVVTSNAASHDNPTWSPDGTTIAFTQGSGVATAAANGTQAASPTVVSGLSGVPAYQPRRADRVARLAGSNRYTTATAVSQSHWATISDSTDRRQKAESVILSRSDTFADALGGSALAVAKTGPLLMTAPTTLHTATTAEIQRVLAPGKTVYLLGGPGAISASVENAIKALGYNTTRLQGANRYTTAVAIANAIDPTPDLVLAATGNNFPDALAAGAAAGSYNTPGSGLSAVVMLTNDAAMPAPVKTYLDGLYNDNSEGPVLFGIGRFAAQAGLSYDPSTVEVWGENRYETALFTAFTFFAGSNYAGFATGANWPDALAGGALMGLLNGPLMLTPGTASSLGFHAELVADEGAGSLHTGIVFGGAPVVNDTQRNQIGSWISGPAGYSRPVNPTDIGLEFGSGGASPNGARALSSRSAATAGSAAQDVNRVRTPEQAAAAADQLRERFAR
ncbi:WD40-like Beta Propeller Repeat [Micromonospora pattaloongensis]|uniref:WD40-like Beta Propeller Repeat n=1 Tax=Micromonospora pattaloongensis TaxID=405436 RepID=A0A1H3HL18_9ACTN|nr:cell wall-binding repeat-containing protein [Micromonospora pattaloongensis]SDY15474.1 WD40-like Beta Propeller Repeat [Micromonospora pattaloongensis]